MIRKLLSNVLVVSLLLTLVVNAISVAPKVNAASLSAGDYVPGELLVKFKDDFSPDALFLAKNNLHSPKKISDNLYLVKIKNNVDALTVAKTVAVNSNVKFAEPNFIYKIQSSPNDDYFSFQWGLFNAAGNGGEFRADIHATEAWNSPYGIGRAFDIGVIDTGIKSDHEDLLGNVASVRNFTSGNGNDNNGHGTHMAGIIGAIAFNDQGIAGINSQAKIHALKAFESAPNGNAIGDQAAIISAIEYAADNNIKLINMSWGSYSFAQGLFDAMAKHPEILFIASSGNGRSAFFNGLPLPNGMGQTSNNDVEPFYPASYELPNVISVTSSNNVDRLDGNYGLTSVDLAAPGDTMTTGINNIAPYGLYTLTRGTSVSAAYVTGAASLYWGGNLEKKAPEIKAAIMLSVDKIDSLAATSTTSGRLNLDNLINDRFTNIIVYSEL